MKNLYYLFILSFLLISCEEEVPPITYTLTTQVTPAGAGKVDPSSGTFDEGSSVTLLATPSENYSFKQWTGSGSGTANPLTFKIISNTSITAVFELIDADGDGVTDALDKCSDTPVGSTVNAEGCATSQLDTDGDGVTDDKDLCAETPDGETVDENGCSDSQVDTDGDGVTDDKDLCVETPDGETVDENGCSDSQKDTDGDGVTDDIDQCSETPEGENVDANGCTVPPKQFTLTVSISTEGPSGLFKINGGDALSTTTAILYDSGTVVELEALDNIPSYTFAKWKGDINNNQIEQNPIQVIMDTVKDIKVLFEPEPEPEDPFLLDANGVTIKVNENMFPEVVPGDKGIVDGVEYTAVDREMLISMVQGGADVTKVVTTLVTDMSLVFLHKTNFNQDISSWDVSNVTNMSNMFKDARNFNQPIGNWDVSSVTDMRYMFAEAQEFNQPIGNWDVSNVTNMHFMFDKATAFNQPIGNWDVSNVTDMSRMFYDARSFNQDINNWNVSNVINMTYLFSFAESFNKNLDNWDVSNVTDMNHMFNGARSFDHDISNWDVSNVTNMEGMFWYSDFNQPLGNWDVSNVTNMDYMFANNIKFNEDIGNWDVSNIGTLYGTFAGATSFNQDIGNWDVSKVTIMQLMFNNAKSFNQDLSKWCVLNVSIYQGFSDGSNLSNANMPVWGTCPSKSTIWNGTTITFTKADGADPEEEANQDRITDNIWITRGNDGGQIFNIKKETSDNKTDSPVGTKWAVGTLDQIETLTFKKFRAAVEKPKSSVGKNLVMYLEEDDIYLSVKFTSWSEQKNGGFAYERSTKQ